MKYQFEDYVILLYFFVTDRHWGCKTFATKKAAKFGVWWYSKWSPKIYTQNAERHKGLFPTADGNTIVRFWENYKCV